MLSNSAFYHKVLRRTIVAFGAMFSDIKIQRRNKDNEVAQTIAVPIAQAPKEKWLVRIDSDPNLDQHTYTTLPRMSFEITGISYDPSRKVNRLNKVSCVDANGASFLYAPVPYNVDISLYVLTRTQEDAFQIVEQILPFFTPEFTLGIKSVDDLNVVTEVPVILTSVSQQDDYDGEFQTRRFVTYTLNFTMKINMFGAVNNSSAITKTIVDIGGLDNRFIDPDQPMVYQLEGNLETGDFTTTITDIQVEELNDLVLDPDASP